VWLSFRGAMAVTGSGFGDGAERQTEMFRSTDRATVNAGAVEAGLRATIGYLKARGKRVGVLLQVPELGFRADTCTGRPVSLSHRPAKSPCAIPASVVAERQAQYRALIANMQRDYGIAVYDPATSLCDSESCYAVADGHMLYHDDNHLGVFGSSWALRRF